ncbi:MAG: pseudouridine synthase [Pseudomonadota bacterium]|nr:pseudouridine synthase [Pseudomonadota bacterium]
MGERIQKALATAGVASRREIERLIGEGSITVNGQPAVLGQLIELHDKIHVNNKPVYLSRKTEPIRLLIFKKRVGELVTRDDPEGRRTVFRKLPKLDSGRWIAVGRLDINTSGLLLLTNNGELARRLTHPSFEIPREYAVRIHGTIEPDTIKKLVTGVELEDGPARFESMRPGANEDGQASNQWFDVRLREGRNREVRRLIESQGLEVSRLIRVSYGPIELGRGIRSSGHREATPEELNAVLMAVGMAEVKEKSKGLKRKPTDTTARALQAKRRERDRDDDVEDAAPRKRGKSFGDAFKKVARPKESKAMHVPRSADKASDGERPERRSSAKPRAEKPARYSGTAVRPTSKRGGARFGEERPSKPAAAARTSRRGDKKESRGAAAFSSESKLHRNEQRAMGKPDVRFSSSTERPADRQRASRFSGDDRSTPRKTGGVARPTRPAGSSGRPRRPPSR